MDKENEILRNYAVFLEEELAVSRQPRLSTSNTRTKDEAVQVKTEELQKVLEELKILGGRCGMESSGNVSIHQQTQAPEAQLDKVNKRLGTGEETTEERRTPFKKAPTSSEIFWRSWKT